MDVESDIKAEIKTAVTNQFKHDLKAEWEKDDPCWDAVEDCYVDSFGQGLEVRLPAHGTNAGWWWKGEGKKYSRHAVEVFLKHVNKIADPAKPTDIKKAYADAKEELREAMERVTRQKAAILAPILCDD